jgi:hypothetical protein
MTNESAGDPGPHERPDLTADFRALGENLKDAVRTAWASEERERLQSEIERGLASLSQTLQTTFQEGARDLASRERMRARLNDARTRVAGLRDELKGETRDRVRSEIHDLLVRLNDEVSRSKERWTRGAKGGPPSS